MQIRISPSLLACDFLHLEEEVRRTEAAGAELLHCDVMDGVFVPNISFGFDIIRAVGTVSALPLDVHMMTCAPQKYIEALKTAGAAIVTVHNDIGLTEAEMIGVLDAIRAAGMIPSVSLRPKISAESVTALLPHADMVLVMTVEPGFGGQKFMADMLPKIRELRAMMDRVNPECILETDGGIDVTTAPLAAAAGCGMAVAGSAVFRAADRAAAIRAIRESAEKNKQ